jgi:hypothetical protein
MTVKRAALGVAILAVVSPIAAAGQSAGTVIERDVEAIGVRTVCGQAPSRIRGEARR